MLVHLESSDANERFDAASETASRLSGSGIVLAIIHAIYQTLEW